MKLARNAFTLIELMVSITILSIMMLFLYQSYASLNMSNSILKEEVGSLSKAQEIKKVIYLDFLLSHHKSVKIDKKERNEDFIIMQSSHSLHKRYNPYIAYIVKQEKLYRIESLNKIKNYDLKRDESYEVDYIAEVKSFRVYKSSDKEKEIYLVHIDFKDDKEVLLKIRALNEK